MKKKQFIKWHVENEDGVTMYDVMHTAWTLNQIHSYILRLATKEGLHDIRRSIVKVTDEATFNDCKNNLLAQPFNRFELLS